MGSGARVGSLLTRWVPLTLAAWAAAEPVQAQVEVAQLDAAVVPRAQQASARLEVSTSTLPRFDGLDSGFASPRVDITLLPPRRSAMGLAVGMSGVFAPTTITGAGLAPASQPAVDVGLHWRHTVDGKQRIDITAWRRVAPEPDAYSLAQASQPTYGARVELNLSSQRKSGLVADRGFLGFQLESGGRFTVRRKDGRPMIYYRTRF
jgi:hypothetical protein